VVLFNLTCLEDNIEARGVEYGSVCRKV